MTKQRVAVAMSGGVDSSLAAALLQQAGYEVIGVTMQIWPSDEPQDSKFGGCCGTEAIESAKRVAYKLGIPHYVMNLRDIFARTVIADFCEEYRKGRTPNPCIRCNQYIKFGVLLERIRELGAQFLATGHYARVDSQSGAYRLLKGIDANKDQSYFLYTLGQKELQYLLLPIGEFRKPEVRKRSAELDLPTANRPESQDVCFIPEGDYRHFISGQVPHLPGDIVDTTGEILGRHKGLASYTVGQRQGLGLPSNQRLYVRQLDVANNRLVVGKREQLFHNGLIASHLGWVAGQPPAGYDNITARIRYRATEAAAQLTLKKDTAEVVFSEPQWAITPGQSVVFYRGEEVLGGGIIESAFDKH